MSLSTAEISTSPRWYPLALDERSGAVKFVELSEQAYRRASFLDPRMFDVYVPTRSVPLAAVALATAGLAERCHFIFHISHVGSTLLSRLVGEHEGLFSLREPALFRALARQHSIRLCAGVAGARWPDALYGQLTSDLLRLWSRTFHEGQTSVIKATSFVSEMARDLLASTERSAATARAVGMLVTPETFLKTMLGGAMVDITSSMASRLDRLRARACASELALPQSADVLSPGEAVAASWLCEVSAIAQAFREVDASGSSRGLWVDFDAFLADPHARLAEVLTHFGATDAIDAASRALSGGSMSRYAKAQHVEFDASTRAGLHARTGVEHAGEIRRGRAWLDARARTAQVAELLELSARLAAGRGARAINAGDRA